MANIKGNGTTIGKFLLIMFAGKTLAMLAAKGINLPVNEVELAGYLGIVLGFIYSALDSYFKNDYRWTHFKKILSIFDKEIEDDNTEDETPEIIETKIEDDDPTIEIEPEVIEDEIVGEDDEC
ncbi:MAG: hypothetical protein IJ258_05620 [Methanobrevibacter sp.]|uniref:hypothetical protein n=1 Tax=Methanobrevibacter sp. TaxID=66852 RepID=UPI0025F81447|nr:hypothetical protein [Methanobrevibacter sp.]MBQ8017570.1 hypothetical protein [Methanobrevibacter sp.]